jgi:hypothetical protein
MDENETIKNETETMKNEMKEEVFTKKEVDKIIKDKIKKERLNYPTEEELTSFKDWKENQKTKEEKQLEEIGNYKREAEEAKKELEELKKIEYIRTKNINNKFINYVKYETSKLAKDENIDFIDALDNFVKDNDMVLNQDTRVVTVDIGAAKGDNTKTKKETTLRKFW